MKEYADSKAYVRPSNLHVGDHVLVKNSSISKPTPYDPAPFTVVQKKGSMVTAQRGKKFVTRNSSFFKTSPKPPGSLHEDDNEDNAESDDQTCDGDDNPDVEPSATPRRSGRAIHKPVRFQDYVCTKIKKKKDRRMNEPF